MKIETKTDTENIDWKFISKTLKSVGMAYHNPEKHQKAFEASYCTIFLYAQDTMVGFGRAISDGAYQAAIYDCAIVKEFQGKGLGKILVHELLSRLKDYNIILYASPGKERFYEKQGFRKLKTGMAYFNNPESMSERGFTE